MGGAAHDHLEIVSQKLPSEKTAEDQGEVSLTEAPTSWHIMAHHSTPQYATSRHGTPRHAMSHHSTPRHAIARQIIAHHTTPWRIVASYSKIVVRELQPHPSACVGGGAAIFNWNNDKTNETTRKEWASGAPANLWVGVPGGPRGRAVGCCGSRGRAPGCPRASWALITWNMEAQSGMNMTSKHCYVTTRGGTPRSSRLRGMYPGATLIMGRHLRSSLSIHLLCGVKCCAMLCVCHACVPWCAAFFLQAAFPCKPTLC